MRFLRFLLLIVAIAAAAAGYYWYTERPPKVAVIGPTRGDAAEIVYANGVIEPRSWAKVTSLVRERITWTCNCEGETVREGDPLARVDDSEAQAVLAELKARHQLAADERDRVALLVERNVKNQSELDRAQSQVAQIEALVAGQEAKLANYALTAPGDGVVLRQDAEVGEIAEPGSVLFWVGRPTPLVVIAEVNEEDIPRVEKGQEALLRSDAFAGRKLGATVDSITPKGDPVTKTYRVRLALPDDTPLLIGMSVDVNIVVRVSQNALLLPTLALQGSDVFIAKDGTARRRTLETGIRGTDAVEIVSGIGEDDLVISPFPEALADGDRIEIEAR